MAQKAAHRASRRDGLRDGGNVGRQAGVDRGANPYGEGGGRPGGRPWGDTTAEEVMRIAGNDKKSCYPVRSLVAMTLEELLLIRSVDTVVD